MTFYIKHKQQPQPKKKKLDKVEVTKICSSVSLGLFWSSWVKKNPSCGITALSSGECCEREVVLSVSQPVKIMRGENNES